MRRYHDGTDHAKLVERLWFPLAVIVGLVGGALIGAELMQLQAPVVPAIQ